MKTIIQCDVAVVGSGPGGAAAARELARAGHDVVVLEQGRRHQPTPSKLKSYGIYDKYAVFSRSKEGVIIDRAITLGGCSVVFSGNAFDPPEWMPSIMGRDLSQTAEEVKVELDVKPFSNEFCANWPAARKLRKSAEQLGANLSPQSKFINEKKCSSSCDGCMTGCRNHAKWTAREWIDQAAAHGARVLTQCKAVRVRMAGTRAVGVDAKSKDGAVILEARNVVLAAGGIGTGVLLQQSGFERAGGNFYMDPMNVLWGMAPKPVAPSTEMTFTYACTDFADSKGFMLGNVSGKGAWISQLMRPKTGWKALGQIGKWDHMVGMFTKIADSPEGRVMKNGAMTKPLNLQDLRKQEEATDLAKRIMTGAGVIPESILVAPNIGGHPGGTAAVGQVVDQDLAVMGASNLYVCDASVFPRSPGRPPTLMILALAVDFGRKLSKAI